jgi:hypothetical protein
MYCFQYILSEFEIGLICFYVMDVFLVSNCTYSTALAHIFIGAFFECQLVYATITEGIRG